MTAVEPESYTRRVPVPHRFGCKTCGHTMSTDNPVAELVEMWRTHHAGHDITEEHDEET